VDLIGTTDRGEVQLTVVVSRPLDTSPRTVKAFGDKLRAYCRYVNRPSFAGEFGLPSAARVKIAVRSTWEVPKELIELMARVRQEEGAPVGLEVRYA
jgi:hypothetical protein